MTDSLLDVVVHAVTPVAEGIRSFDLRRPDGSDLPPFTAGSHIDVHLPNGLVRCYSLVNSQAERHRYVLGVSLDRNSSGGSAYMFENDLTGQALKIGAPRNNFALVEDADLVVLIGGGIGITPLHSMIARLEELGKDWQLHYGVRDRASAAFREEFEALEAAKPGRVHFNFDLEDGHFLDVAKVVKEAPSGAHLYCCGPAPMLELYKTAAEGRAPGTVHLEYFAAPDDAVIGSDESFTVVLKSTGQEFEIPAGESILGVLLDNGVSAPYSCGEGECASCLVEVLEGVPDHRDYVLGEKERAENKLMTICVSGSKTKRLVLNL